MHCHSSLSSNPNRNVEKRVNRGEGRRCATGGSLLGEAVVTAKAAAADVSIRKFGFSFILVAQFVSNFCDE